VLSLKQKIKEKRQTIKLKNINSIKVLWWVGLHFFDCAFDLGGKTAIGDMLSWTLMFVFSLEKKSMLLMYLGQLNGYVNFMCFCRLYIIHSSQSRVSKHWECKVKPLQLKLWKHLIFNCIDSAIFNCNNFNWKYGTKQTS